jgi:hypothetical protein
MSPEFTSRVDRFFHQPISAREGLKRMSLLASVPALASAAALIPKPATAQEYRFEYTAPQNRQLIQCQGREIDGKVDQRWYLNPEHPTWLYREWGSIDLQTARKWGITRWHEPKIGVYAKYADLHYAILGYKSHAVEQARDIANEVLRSAPEHASSWGHCGLVASAQALETEPRRWFGSHLYGVPVNHDDQKGMLSASYHEVGGYSAIGEPGQALSDDQKRENVPLMLEMYKQGWPVVGDCLMDGETSGVWFRKINGVREDGQVVSVSKLGLPPEDVLVSRIRSAEVVFHLKGPDQGFDPRWAEVGRPYWITEMRLDIVRHANFGTPLV